MYLSDQRALAQSKLTSTHLIMSTATAIITSHTLRIPPQEQCCVPPSDVLHLPLVLQRQTHWADFLWKGEMVFPAT